MKGPKQLCINLASAQSLGGMGICFVLYWHMALVLWSPCAFHSCNSTQVLCLSHFLVATCLAFGATCFCLNGDARAGGTDAAVVGLPPAKGRPGASAAPEEPQNTTQLRTAEPKLGNTHLGEDQRS
uniref:Uncharacterized protein n=1 Tax=Eutreptiella gymnastica TaxID=73025 RepID=A0A7S4LBZ3_9EUGL